MKNINSEIVRYVELVKKIPPKNLFLCVKQQIPNLSRDEFEKELDMCLCQDTVGYTDTFEVCTKDHKDRYHECD